MQKVKETTVERKINLSKLIYPFKIGTGVTASHATVHQVCSALVVFFLLIGCKNQ